MEQQGPTEIRAEPEREALMRRNKRCLARSSQALVAGDESPAFFDYSHAEALDQLLWFIDFWPTQATPTSASQ